jgi:hypothetical protein
MNDALIRGRPHAVPVTHPPTLLYARTLSRLTSPVLLSLFFGWVSGRPERQPAAGVCGGGRAVSTALLRPLVWDYR